MSRRRLVALVVAPTLLVGLLVGVGLVAGDRAVQADVEKADRAATTYRVAQDRFVAKARRILDRTDVEDPREVAEAAEGLEAEVPRLPDAPERGADGSADYRAAQQEAAEQREAVVELGTTATEAQEVRRFVLAANEALDIDPQAILPESAFVDGAPVRDRLLPRVREALAGFEDVEVPEGAGPVAADVRAALDALRKEGETLAAELDAGRGYRFEYGLAFGQAEAAVKGLADTVRADLQEAVDRVLGAAADA